MHKDESRSIKCCFSPKQIPCVYYIYILLHIFRNSTDNANDKCLTVVFHAILSDKFKLNEGTKIVIRGDEPVFGGWKNGSVNVRRGE
jgi:hypothetical protein